MKTILTAAMLLLAPALVPAQTAAKPAADTAAQEPAKKKRSVSRTEIKSTAKNIAAGIEAAEAALTPDELAIAERVHVGKLPCELGTSVTLAADAKAPGYFNVDGKNFRYRMFPVATTTGAIRLEDRKAGAVWLQLANKSMLMNQKLGIRLADECMSPAQAAVAEALKANPAPSVLDAPRPAMPPASAPLATPAASVVVAPATAPIGQATAPAVPAAPAQPASSPQ
ncbi:hypothetical protein [Polaromonas sp.]|uniref:hypothetical protein n=1 Tax=Polaromonas sp. TaxID=1869339 RepID=UPI002FC912A8